MTLGLAPALKWLTSQSNKLHKTGTHPNIIDFNQELQPEMEVNIFRIV